MQANSFNNWKEHPVTKALMKFIQEEVDEIRGSCPSKEDLYDKHALAMKIGFIEAYERILSIAKEDLKEDES